MQRRIFAMMLTGILLFTALGFQSVGAQTGTDMQRAAQTRTKVDKLGVGRDARVEVKLRDNTKLKGYVSAASADSFTVTDAKTGAAQTLAYADVMQVKKPGSGVSARTWIILGAVATAAVIVGVTVIKPVVCDGGAGC